MSSSSSEFSQENHESQFPEPNLMAKALVKLEVRLQTVEIKLMSLTNVVRLLQQYTEKKDQQYERQTHNMQAICSKLAKVDELQTELLRATGKSDQLFAHMRSYTLKMDQVAKGVQERQNNVNLLQDRFNYEMSELTKKFNKIETGMLQQIRENNKKNQEKPNNNNPGTNYAIQEISFKLQLLQNKLWNAHKKLKEKLQKMQKGHRSNNLDYYGSFEQKQGKSISKQSSKNKQNSALKRLKSK